jgi:hypothetical protein
MLLTAFCFRLDSTILVVLSDAVFEITAAAFDRTLAPLCCSDFAA